MTEKLISPEVLDNPRFRVATKKEFDADILSRSKRIKNLFDNRSFWQKAHAANTLGALMQKYGLKLESQNSSHCYISLVPEDPEMIIDPKIHFELMDALDSFLYSYGIPVLGHSTDMHVQTYVPYNRFSEAQRRIQPFNYTWHLINGCAPSPQQ